jgi:hypothetical protein
MAWFAWLIIGIVLQVISYILTPRPKGPKPEEVKDLEAPTSDAGRPMPVVFGTLTVKSPNCLWYGQVKKYVWIID